MVAFLLALWFASYKIKGKRNFERCTDTKLDLPEKCRYLRMTLFSILSNIPVSFIHLGNDPPFSRQLSGAPNDGFLLNTLETLLGYPEYRLEAF